MNRRHELKRDPMEREAWIIDAVRSPRGKGKENGSLHPIHPQRILAQVLNALQARNGFDTADVDDVVMGCGAGSGDHAMDIARMAALDAGWSLDAPGVTLNRFCGSGQQAVNFAAMGVLAGFQDLVVGGGVESMSRPAPLHVDGFTANNHHLRDQYDMVAQGISADLIATRRGLHPRGVRPARRRQPGAGPGGHRRRSLRAGARADLRRRRHARPRPRRVPPARHHAREPGQADAELREDGRRGRARHASSPSTRRRCWPTRTSTEIRHVHHAGNSSGVVDGASAVLVVSPDYARAHGMTPRAKIVMTRRRRHRAGHHAHRARTGGHPLRGEGGHDASTTST